MDFSIQVEFTTSFLSRGTFNYINNQVIYELAKDSYKKCLPCAWL
jgi:hypothetical protein